MAWLRRLLSAARDRPAVAVAAIVVLIGSGVASAAVVATTGGGDDGGSALPTTTSTTTSTTSAPTTTAPTTTTTTTTAPTTTAPTTTTVDPGQRCLVRLHGKGAGGADTYTQDDGVKVLTPQGNDRAWGAYQWLYFPNNRYNAARDIVRDTIRNEGCDTVIVNGFSNGGAFAAKLFCRGETFGGTVIRYVIDDPVPDEGVDDCEPDGNVAVTLYWTGYLDRWAEPGWDCREEDWTCEGGETIGIDAYADELGIQAMPSRFTDHQWYQDAPELSAW